MQLHHAGIATNRADERAQQYTALFDTNVVHEEPVNGLRVQFLPVGESYFELLEPTDEGPIASYLDTHGPGIHHLAVETSDIEAALDRARELDIELIDDEPRQGAWGHDIAFVHPRATGGVLFEFVHH